MKVSISSNAEFLQSRYEGACKLERSISAFNISVNLDRYTITVEDKLYKDDVDENGDAIRRYVDAPVINKFNRADEDINTVFAAIGIDIVKPEEFHSKLMENMQAILLAESQQVSWKGTNDYVIDPIA